MNLQETIKRILREELSTRVRRRVPYDEMEREFLKSFEDAYDLTKKRKVLSRHFLNELIYTTIHMMMDGIHLRFNSTLPKDEFWYEDIYTELENHYIDRIIQMYNERKGINESILREETNFSKRRILRRVDSDKIDKIFRDGLGLLTVRYRSTLTLSRFKQQIISYVIVELCTTYDDLCGGETEFYDQIFEFLSENYSDEMEERWDKIISEKNMDSTNKKNPDELDEYARTLKNARQQGVGLRFPKSAIKANPLRFRPYNR